MNVFSTACYATYTSGQKRILPHGKHALQNIDRFLFPAVVSLNIHTRWRELWNILSKKKVVLFKSHWCKGTGSPVACRCGCANNVFVSDSQYVSNICAVVHTNFPFQFLFIDLWFIFVQFEGSAPRSVKSTSVDYMFRTSIKLPKLSNHVTASIHKNILWHSKQYDNKCL